MGNRSSKKSHKNLTSGLPLCRRNDGPAEDLLNDAGRRRLVKDASILPLIAPCATDFRNNNSMLQPSKEVHAKDVPNSVSPWQAFSTTTTTKSSTVHFIKSTLNKIYNFRKSPMNDVNGNPIIRKVPINRSSDARKLTSDDNAFSSRPIASEMPKVQFTVFPFSFAGSANQLHKDKVFRSHNTPKTTPPIKPQNVGGGATAKPTNVVHAAQPASQQKLGHPSSADHHLKESTTALHAKESSSTSVSDSSSSSGSGSGSRSSSGTPKQVSSHALHKTPSHALHETPSSALHKTPSHALHEAPSHAVHETSLHELHKTPSHALKKSSSSSGSGSSSGSTGSTPEKKEQHSGVLIHPPSSQHKPQHTPTKPKSKPYPPSQPASSNKTLPKRRSNRTINSGSSKEPQQAKAHKGCCHPVAPPVYLDYSSRCGGGGGYQGGRNGGIGGGIGGSNGNAILNMLKNVDVIEELQYQVPVQGGDCGDNNSDDSEFEYYYRCNECGEMEPCNKNGGGSLGCCGGGGGGNEGCGGGGGKSKKPVVYSRRQRFNFANGRHDGDNDGPPFATPNSTACPCHCCRAGLRRNPDCQCKCCGMKGNNRGANDFDEYPVGKNPEPYKCICKDEEPEKKDVVKEKAKEDHHHHHQKYEKHNDDPCADLLPKNSGIYFYDADQKKFVQQEPRPLTPIMIDMEDDCCSPPQSSLCYQQEQEADLDLTQVIRCIPPLGNPRTENKAQAPLVLPIVCGGYCDMNTIAANLEAALKGAGLCGQSNNNNDDNANQQKQQEKSTITTYTTTGTGTESNSGKPPLSVPTNSSDKKQQSSGNQNTNSSNAKYNSKGEDAQQDFDDDEEDDDGSDSGSGAGSSQ